MTNDGKLTSGLVAVAIAVAVALVAANQAPWWLELLGFSPHRSTPAQLVVAARPDVPLAPQATPTPATTATPAPHPTEGAAPAAATTTAAAPGLVSLPPGSEMGALEFNTNRQKHDLNTGLEVRRADDCSDLCAREDRCRAMTFVEHPNGEGGICWLKNGGTEPIAWPGMISAAKLLGTIH